MNIREAIDLINTQGRNENDPPIVVLCICSLCGIEYARQPQDKGLTKSNGAPDLCNKCKSVQRLATKRNRAYHNRNNFGWNNCLGIAFPKTGSIKTGDGPYTELMHRFELWLRDEKGYPEGKLISSDKQTELRKEFFDKFIVEEPLLFSTQPIKYVKHYGEGVYVCTGCQSMMSPSYLAQCCPQKKNSVQ